MAPRTIRIVHLITGLNLGGAERMLGRLVQAMDRSRFENVVISMLPGGVVREAIVRAGVEVHTLDIEGLGSSVHGSLRLAGLLRTIRPSILQTWLYHADVLGLPVGRSVGVPRILWNLRSTMIQGNWPRTMQRIRGALSPYPDGVIVNSHSVRAVHEALGYTPRKWHFIPNGFDTASLRPQPERRLAMRKALALPEDARVVGMMARYHPFKDHALFAKAAILLLRAVPKAYFVLSGTGVDDTNVELSNMLDPAVRAHVRLLGPRTDVPDLASALDVATLTSFTEGFPNVVAEAMSCGLPCVVTDAGDAASIVGATGWCVPVRNAPALAAAWQAALGMTEAGRRDLGSAARRRIEEHFSLDHIARRYEELYLATSGSQLSDAGRRGPGSSVDEAHP